jgi:asparagine synthase (glutamine-hydrolysing)
MCGIAGFIDTNINYDATVTVKRMGDAILNRGPDSYGIWNDVNYGVNFIHMRLAILDLSSAGHQPMVSLSGRYVIVFNGEVYNFKEMATKLEQQLGNVNWRGHSDTEVILLAIEVYGFEGALQKMEGMFAIAVWDRQTQQLYLARDRLGEKPLYYGYFNGVFGFASQLSALCQHPKFNKIIDRNALGQMMLHGCVPAPMSIFEGVYKLMPGHYQVLTYQSFLNQEIPSDKVYWSLENVTNTKYSGSAEQAIDKLESLLFDAVSKQMMADVPVGCFLSGGVDSSTIAALMQKQSSQPINTFCIGFDVHEYNEAIYASAIAKHLGTNHTELYISDSEALKIVPELPHIYDEPFSDSSQIPTYLVSKLAKQNVTVTLSGDGGDELFAGYSRYGINISLYSKFNVYPKWFLEAAVALAKPELLSFINKFITLPIRNFSDKQDKLKVLLQSKGYLDFYLKTSSHWSNFADLVLGTSLQADMWFHTKINENKNLTNLTKMQLTDLITYLPDDILVKVDRAAMINSLETRVPLLNHNIVEFAFSLPDEYKNNNGATKWILRQVLYRYVPRQLIERPKKGFSVPICHWLRGSLKEWANSLLDPTVIKEQGFFDYRLIQDRWKAHLSGKQDFSHYLWDILIFQEWYQNLSGRS